MRMQDAVALMRMHEGYRVHFERREPGMLASDYFPERDEPAIAEVEDAWRLAEKFAQLDPSLFVNVYVVSAYDWTPVEGYRSRLLNGYPTATAEPESAA